MTKHLHQLIKKAAESHSPQEIAQLTGMPERLVDTWIPAAILRSYSPEPLDGSMEDILGALTSVEDLPDLEGEPATQLDSEGSEARLVVDDEKDQAYLAGTVGGKYTTLEEVFEKMGLSRDEWTIKALEIVDHTTGMKVKSAARDADGNLVFSETPHQQRNYSFRVKLVPNWEARIKVPALEALMSRLRESGPKGAEPIVQPPVFDEPHLLVINPADLHIAKRGVDEGWSIKDAMAEYKSCLVHILQTAALFNVEQIVVWYGNDAGQADNFRGQTTKGTQVETSSGWHNQFDAMIDLGILTVNQCRKYAKKVYLHHVPGNHDWLTSYAAMRAVMEHFKDAEDVTTSVSTNGRVVHSYGNVAIMGTHGNNTTFKTAAMTMAIEYPKEWAAATATREVHTGHKHSKDGGTYMSKYFENEGVTVRQAPSLSKTDSWHSIHGYVGAVRAMEGYLYHRDNGYHLTISANRFRA